MIRLLVVVLVLMGASVLCVRLIQERGEVADFTESPKAVAQSMASKPKASNARTVVIKSENGHFAADARVDGRRIAFMVDTGASAIAIRATDAARLGFHPRPRDYDIKIQTANGEGRAASVELSRVEVGDISVRNVRALVVPDAALGVNLLGMSFLSRVRWTHERGQLVLEQ